MSARSDRRVALGRAHELQGHDQYPARSGERASSSSSAAAGTATRGSIRPPISRRPHATRSTGCSSSKPSGWRTACIDPDECESERTVIISELQGGDNDPEQLLDTEVTAAAFKAHRTATRRSAGCSDLETMTRDDLYGHYRDFYVPNNATLVVVGDVDADDVLRRVERQFGADCPGALPPACRTVEPAQVGERRVTIERAGTTAYLKLAWHAPEAKRPRFLPDARPRRRADGRKGRQSLVVVPQSSPAQRPAVSRARGSPAWRPRVFGALLPTEHPFLLLGRGARLRKAFRSRRWKKRRSTCSTRCGRRHHSGRAPACEAPAAGRGSCSSRTASRTSPTSSGTSRPLPTWTSITDRGTPLPRSASTRSPVPPRRACAPAIARWVGSSRRPAARRRSEHASSGPRADSRRAREWRGRAGAADRDTCGRDDAGCRARRQRPRSRRPIGTGPFRLEGDRSRHRDAKRRCDSGGARRPRSDAELERGTSPADARLYVSGRRFRRHDRTRRRRRATARRSPRPKSTPGAARSSRPSARTKTAPRRWRSKG